ncbi:hypothetical protein ASG74_10710 [Knoellia sp. Soil729]|nr:hypothetical protein ASG74_10710 [Knoellia sp. Soil729]
MSTRCLYLFGELDDTFDPRSRAAGHVIRSGIVQGPVAPGDQKAGQGSSVYADGRWGPGEVYSFPELSIVGTPRAAKARWRAPRR